MEKQEIEQPSSGRERILTQYAKSGNAHYATSQTVANLAPGSYSVYLTMEGKAVFERVDVKSDALLRLKNGLLTELSSEFKKFWENADSFKKLGFTHKRGFMFHGAPGTGKSCYLKLAMEEMVKDGSVVFLVKSAGAITEVLKQFKEVEPTRKVLVVLEDIDELIQYNEHALLELMDGPNSVDGVFYLGTTNYLSRISPRMLRKSRFDRVIEIGPPDEADRLEYFKSKLGVNESEEQITALAKATQGFVFSDMKDLLVSVYCLGIPVDKALKEMKMGGMKTWGGSLEAKEFSERFILEILPKIELQPLNEAGKVVTIAGQLLSDLALVEKGGLDFNGLPDAEQVKLHMEKRLKGLHLEDVTVDNVEVDSSGNILIDFVSTRGDMVTCSFSYDEEEGASAIVYNPDDKEEDEESYQLIVDLDPLGPSIVKTNHGWYMNLMELAWLSRATMLDILDAGDFGLIDQKPAVSYDAHGNIQQVPYIESKVEEIITRVDEQGFKIVVRGGKKIRRPILRRKRKKRLTPKQRTGLRKAARTRKSSSSKRKRSMSLRLRKRLKLKPSKRRKGYRVG